MGYLAAVLSFAIWGGVSTLLVRFIPLPAPFITTVAFAVGGIVTALRMGGARLRECREAFALHGGRIALSTFVAASCSMTYHWAIKTTTVANAVITHSCQALFTCLVFLPLAGRGRPTNRALVSLILGMAGLVTAFWEEFSPGTRPIGIILGLTSAVLYGWYNILVPYFEGKVRRDTLICCSCAVGTAIMMGYCLILWSFGTFDGFAWHPLGLPAIGALIAMGVLNYAISSPLYLYAIEHAPIAHVAIISYIEPVIGIGMGAAFLGEPFTARAVVGGILVLSSSALVVTGRPS